MSFGFRFIGKPAKVKAAIDEYTAKQTGATRIELDAIVPAIHTLIDQQVTTAGQPEAPIDVDANGHAYFIDGVKQYGNATVRVVPISGWLVE